MKERPVNRVVGLSMLPKRVSTEIRALCSCSINSFYKKGTIIHIKLASVYTRVMVEEEASTRNCPYVCGCAAVHKHHSAKVTNVQAM